MAKRLLGKEKIASPILALGLFFIYTYNYFAVIIIYFAGFRLAMFRFPYRDICISIVNYITYVIIANNA